MTITVQPAKGTRTSIRNYMREKNPFNRSDSLFTAYVDLNSVDEEAHGVPNNETDTKMQDINSTTVNLRSKPFSPNKPPRANLQAKHAVRQSTQVLDALKDLSVGDNLEKFLDKHGLRIRNVQIEKLKEALQVLLSDQQAVKVKEIPKWENRLSQMHEFRDSRRLSKWMESVGGTEDQVNVPKIQEELKRYFENQNTKVKQPILKEIAEPVWGVKLVKEETDDEKNEDHLKKEAKVQPHLSKAEVDEPLNNLSLVKPKPQHLALGKNKLSPRIKRSASVSKLDDFKGRSLFFQEETMASKIWKDFRHMNAPKQVAVVVGITVATAALGMVSWRLLALTFPSAFSMNNYWGEVLAQWFMQRQESTYNLLMHTAENSKPLSTAWANQYILWKYI